MKFVVPEKGVEKRCLLIALMMEAASTFETSVNFYRTTRRNNPEVNHPQFLFPYLLPLPTHLIPLPVTSNGRRTHIFAPTTVH
jgi:hypothetical protein